MGLTGTWLDKGKLPGLFFLLLLLLLVPPPPLMVLPPDILRFRRLFGACLDGSAAHRKGFGKSRFTAMWRGQRQFCALPTWRRHHPLPLLEEAGLEAVSGTEVVRLVSRHQFLHWLQNHTQLVGKARGNVTRMKMVVEPTQVQVLLALPEILPRPRFNWVGSGRGGRGQAVEAALTRR